MNGAFVQRIQKAGDAPAKAGFFRRHWDAIRARPVKVAIRASLAFIVAGALVWAYLSFKRAQDERYAPLERKIQDSLQVQPESLRPLAKLEERFGLSISHLFWIERIRSSFSRKDSINSFLRRNVPGKTADSLLPYIETGIPTEEMVAHTLHSYWARMESDSSLKSQVIRLANAVNNGKNHRVEEARILCTMLILQAAREIPEGERRSMGKLLGNVTWKDF